MVRLKTRYLVVEVAAGRKTASLSKEDISTAIKESIARSYGDYGVGVLQYAFQVLFFDSLTGFGVIRCAREQSKLVETSLVFITELQAQEVRVRVARVCGCSRTCRQHVLQLALAKSTGASDEAIASLKAAVSQIDVQ